jgi:dTDP-4-dehydrorhamnose reductase
MKILVTGAGGLVGRATVAHCGQRGEEVVGLDHRGLDISDATAVRSVFDHEGPEVVINCAAWTNVDGCESDPDRATKANALGPELLAQECCRTKALLITISTDYVFNGEHEGFYTQRDQPDPKSVYAASKLAGERRAQTAWARTIVVRSGYIFGDGGTNFLSTFMTRARAGEPVKVISDSYGTPTYAPHVAAQLYRLAQRDLPGIYHIVNAGGGASFEGFARVAFGFAGLDTSPLQPITMDSLSRPAARPRNSRLRCLLSEAIGLESMPFWEDAVKEFVG